MGKFDSKASLYFDVAVKKKKLKKKTCEREKSSRAKKNK